MLSNEKLAQLLPILNNLWLRKYDRPIEKSDIHFDDDGLKDSAWNFYMRISKGFGLDNDAETFYYILNSLYDNQENIVNQTLSNENVINPNKKEYVINISETRIERVTIWGRVFYDSYATSDQLYRDAYALGTEDYIQLWDYEETDRDVYDSDSIDGIEIDGVEKYVEKYNNRLRTNESNSLHKFLDSLNESEIKFLQQELGKRLL